MSKRTREREAALDRLYAQLPSLDCKGLCGDSCHFIAMTELEHDRIQRSGGPDIQRNMTPCPALNFMRRCNVYKYRPLICRLWGIVETMPCLWGCKPERYLTDEEGKSFLAQARAIGGEMTLL